MYIPWGYIFPSPSGGGGDGWMDILGGIYKRKYGNQIFFNNMTKKVIHSSNKKYVQIEDIFFRIKFVIK
jgi:hypothetical protein